jgi:uncharacterized protein YwlG (UPF0340 family)
MSTCKESNFLGTHLEGHESHEMHALVFSFLEQSVNPTSISFLHKACENALNRDHLALTMSRKLRR